MTSIEVRYYRQRNCLYIGIKRMTVKLVGMILCDNDLQSCGHDLFTCVNVLVPFGNNLLTCGDSLNDRKTVLFPFLGSLETTMNGHQNVV